MSPAQELKPLLDALAKRGIRGPRATALLLEHADMIGSEIGARADRAQPVVKFADLDTDGKRICMGLIEGNGRSVRDTAALDSMAPHVRNAQRVVGRS